MFSRWETWVGIVGVAGAVGCSGSCDAVGCNLPEARITVAALDSDGVPWTVTLCSSGECDAVSVGRDETQVELDVVVTTMSNGRGGQRLIVQKSGVVEGGTLSLTIEDESGTVVASADEAIVFDAETSGSSGCERRCKGFSFSISD